MAQRLTVLNISLFCHIEPTIWIKSWNPYTVCCGFEKWSRNLAMHEYILPCHSIDSACAQQDDWKLTNHRSNQYGKTEGKTISGLECVLKLAFFLDVGRPLELCSAFIWLNFYSRSLFTLEAYLCQFAMIAATSATHACLVTLPEFWYFIKMAKVA